MFLRREKLVVNFGVPIYFSFFIKDHQAQTFGFDCLKQKFIIIKVHTAFITLPKYIG